jgi:hypothetical protein
MPRGKKSDDPWNRILLPNAGSKKATPASLRVDLEYERKNIWGRFTWERFVRLCNLLTLTPEELASVACIPHRALPLFEKNNHLFNGRSPDRSGALVLTLLEAHVAGHLTKDVVENAFPNLAEIPESTGCDHTASSPSSAPTNTTAH